MSGQFSPIFSLSVVNFYSVAAMSDVEQLLRAAGNPTDVSTASVAAIVMAALRQQETSFANRFDAILGKVSALDSDLKAHKEATTASFEALKADNARLSSAVARLTQHSMDFNLLLHGIPEDLPALNGSVSARDPCFRDAVLSALQKFDPSICCDDFEKAHRLGPPAAPSTTPTTTSRSRPIVIKLFNRYKREKLLDESIRRWKAANKKSDPSVPYLTSHNLRGLVREPRSAFVRPSSSAVTHSSSRGQKRPPPQSQPSDYNDQRRQRRPNIAQLLHGQGSAPSSAASVIMDQSTS